MVGGGLAGSRDAHRFAMQKSPEVCSPEPGRGRVVLVVSPHADDAALFIGGTIALWTASCWRVVIVRVTDDRWDSVGVDEAETIRRHALEVRRAASALGVAEVVDLGWPTNTLADISENALREQIIRQIRTHKPYALRSISTACTAKTTRTTR